MRFSFWALLSIVGLTLASPVPELVHKDLAKRETALNAFLTVLLDYLPALDGTISSVVDVLTVFENLLALLTGEQTTYNELGGSCKTYTVIFGNQPISSVPYSELPITQAGRMRCPPGPLFHPTEYHTNLLQLVGPPNLEMSASLWGPPFLMRCVLRSALQHSRFRV
jgi:hypothetical protein